MIGILAAEPATASAVSCGWIAAITGLITFVLGCVLTRLTIRKTEAEIIALEAEQVGRIQEKQREYDDHGAECTRTANLLFHAIKADSRDAQLICTHREKFCELVFGGMMSRMLNVAELEAIESKADPEDLRRYIDDALVPDLQQVRKWLTVANLPELLSIIGSRSPMRPKKRTFRRFRKIARHLPMSDKPAYYAKIDEAILAICDADH